MGIVYSPIYVMFTIWLPFIPFYAYTGRTVLTSYVSSISQNVNWLTMGINIRQLIMYVTIFLIKQKRLFEGGVYSREASNRVITVVESSDESVTLWIFTAIFHVITIKLTLNQHVNEQYESGQDAAFSVIQCEHNNMSVRVW